MKANNIAKKATAESITGRQAMIDWWIRDYKSDLEKMNAGKIGAPYKYTDKFMYWILIVKSFYNEDYQEVAAHIAPLLELIMESDLSKYLPSDFTCPNFTTIFRRMKRTIETIISNNYASNDLVLCAFVSKKTSEKIRECAVDSTALNLSNTNLWRKVKWGVGPAYRGWVKIHALVDVDSNEIIAAIVTTDKMGDNSAFTMLTELAFDKGHGISRITADSAYECRSNWRDSMNRGYAFVVKFKCNCNGKSNGVMARGSAAIEYLSMTYEEWRAKTKYGRRWKSECTFSDFKRLISEQIAAVTDTGVIVETIGKIIAFDRYKEIRASIVGITCNGVTIA